MHGWAVALGCGSGWWLLAAPANAVVGTNLSPRSRYLASIAMRSAVTTSDKTSDPRQPSRLLKKKKIRSTLPALPSGLQPA